MVEQKVEKWWYKSGPIMEQSGQMVNTTLVHL